MRHLTASLHHIHRIKKKTKLSENVFFDKRSSIKKKKEFRKHLEMFLNDDHINAFDKNGKK